MSGAPSFFAGDYPVASAPCFLVVLPFVPYVPTCGSSAVQGYRITISSFVFVIAFHVHTLLQSKPSVIVIALTAWIKAGCFY